MFFACSNVRAEHRVVAYVPNWVDLKTFVEQIDYAKLTHINVAFENPRNDDGDLSFNEKDRVLIERAKANKVKVLVSIGGGAASGNKTLQARYFELLTDAKRPAFVAKLAEYVTAHGFDGLDVDIEGPSINKDYGAFVADLGKAFRAKGLLLTSALSKGYGGSHVPDAALAEFDFVNIMAYDGKGYWNPKDGGQHSSMEFVKENVAYWLKRGLPKSKAVLGVPFYGYGFGDAFRKGDYSYKKILSEYPGAEKVDQVGNTIWYNGLPTIRAKAKYVADEGLGGVMIWSLDYDVPGERSLLTAIHDALHEKGVVAPAPPAPAGVNFRAYKHPVTTWVPPYAVAKSKARLTEEAGVKGALTHLALQFWVPTAEGGVALVKNRAVTDAAISELRDWGHANGIRVMLCVYNAGGGKWDWDLAKSAFAHHREAFVKSLLAEADRLGLDGVDIDLEGAVTFEPDHAAFVTFMTELSKALHANGKHLTIDTFQSFKWNAPNQSAWSEILPLVDGLASMGYGDSGQVAPDWRSYDEQRKAAGEHAGKLQIGMPSDKEKWRGNSVQEQVVWVRKDGTMGVAIWDAQLPSAAWRSADVWAALRAIRDGEK